MASKISKTKLSKSEETFKFSPESLDSNPRKLSEAYYDSNFYNEWNTPVVAGLDAARYGNLFSRSYPLQNQQGFYYIRQAIILCQTAWMYVPVFFQTIETMTVLANTGIEWRGGSDNAKKFFDVWWDKVNGYNFTEQFFRELTLSSNVPIYRYDGSVKKNKINKLVLSNQETSEAAKTIKIPIKYAILNPADICVREDDFCQNNILPSYYRTIDSATVDRLKKLAKNGDITLPDSLKDCSGRSVEPLDADNFTFVFFKKQDYYPLAVPMGFCVLEDINLKMEFKKADACVAKTVDSLYTLVTHGATDKDGNTVMNPLVDSALKQIFSTNQKNKTIVSDCTTKVDFAIPDINKVIGNEKYQKIDQDINDGLFNIFFGEQQFSTMAIKLRVFVKLLVNIQEIFLTQFLNSEIKRVGKLVGFTDKDIPVPKFKKIDLEDPAQIARIYAQFAQLGLLTPDETFKAMETGLLPTKDDALSSQEEYKKHRKNDLFYPLVGGSKDEEVKPGVPGGRPKGTKAPQKTKKISPKGASIEGTHYLYDVQKFKSYTLLANEVANEVKALFCYTKNKKRLSTQDKRFINSTATNIIINEIPDNWKNSISIYLEKQPDINFEKIGLVEEIKEVNEIDEFGAAILSHCIIESE